MRGKLILLTAPSGTGKTTIVRRVLKCFDNLEFSISACSREKRKGEVEGENYYFLSKEEFKKKIELNEFLEFEQVYKDHFYGTLKKQVEDSLKMNKNLIFDIDVNGTIKIKNIYPKNSLSIFLDPPSIDELRDRLEKRGSEDAKSIKIRLSKAEEEIAKKDRFDFVLINDDLEKTFSKVRKLIEVFLEKR